MTVKQLTTIRNLLVPALTIIWITVVICLRRTISVNIAVLLFFGYLLLYFILRMIESLLQQQIYRRLNFIISESLDPGLLKEGITSTFSWTILSKKAEMVKQMYLETYARMAGAFQDALDICKSTTPVNDLAKKALVSEEFYLLIQLGLLDQASTMLEKVNLLCKSTNKDVEQNSLRCVALYHLRKGETSIAREYLSRSYEAMSTNLSKLSYHFHFAELEASERNNLLALDHYRQAAAIGPKTWMGQESARRAEALQQQLDNGNQNDRVKQA